MTLSCCILVKLKLLDRATLRDLRRISLALRELTSFSAVVFGLKHEGCMSDNKNPAEKRPGEKEPGKFHYNPGNQSGKAAEKTLTKPESELDNNRDRTESRTEEPPKSR